MFSKISGQLRLVGGAVFLTLGYLPVLFNSVNNGATDCELKFSMIDAGECSAFSSDNCQFAVSEMLNKLNVGRNENLQTITGVNFEVGKSIVTNSTEKLIKTKSPAPKNLAIKDIKSGHYKGSKLVKGVIRSNFYADARKLGIPAGIVDKIISKLSGRIDFRRSLKKGDHFEVAFSGKHELLYSKIRTRGREASVYKFGEEGYFFENGEKVAASTGTGTFGLPLKGKLKVSSPYGVRLHPIHKRYHRHSGVDLVASYGSPVYAVFDGTVTRASSYAGYGKCIDVAHKGGYSSRYGHLSRYAVKVGSRVKKGQLIAYTGSSGASTGPHLHLELARNNSTVNPLSVKMLPTEVKKVSSAKKFAALKRYVKTLVETLAH